MLEQCRSFGLLDKFSMKISHAEQTALTIACVRTRSLCASVPVDPASFEVNPFDPWRILAGPEVRIGELSALPTPAASGIFRPGGAVRDDVQDVRAGPARHEKKSCAA
jgi:hypothetical protein